VNSPTMDGWLLRAVRIVARGFLLGAGFSVALGVGDAVDCRGRRSSRWQVALPAKPSRYRNDLGICLSDLNRHLG
jgi:hypothetical protein